MLPGTPNCKHFGPLNIMYRVFFILLQDCATSERKPIREAVSPCACTSCCETLHRQSMQACEVQCERGEGRHLQKRGTRGSRPAGRLRMGMATSAYSTLFVNRSCVSRVASLTLATSVGMVLAWRGMSASCREGMHCSASGPSGVSCSDGHIHYRHSMAPSYQALHSICKHTIESCHDAAAYHPPHIPASP